MLGCLLIIYNMFRVLVSCLTKSSAFPKVLVLRMVINELCLGGDPRCRKWGENPDLFTSRFNMTPAKLRIIEKLSLVISYFWWKILRINKACLLNISAKFTELLNGLILTILQWMEVQISRIKLLTNAFPPSVEMRAGKP